MGRLAAANARMIVTWRIGEAERSGAARERFLADSLVFWAQLSRQPGHFAGHATRTAVATMVSVNVYVSQKAADAALGDRVGLVERVAGAVFDLRFQAGATLPPRSAIWAVAAITLLAVGA